MAADRERRAGAPTTDAIRAGIDSGRAGDKRAFPDLAAAPLGTDDEAAGTPPTAEQRRMAAAAEIHARVDDTQPSEEGHVPYSAGRRQGTTAPVLLAVVAVIALVLVGVWLLA